MSFSVQVIFDQMLSSSFDMDTIHSTSGAVYAIICYHKVYIAVQHCSSEVEIVYRQGANSLSIVERLSTLLECPLAEVPLYYSLRPPPRPPPPPIRNCICL